MTATPQLPENTSTHNGPDGEQLLNAKFFTRLVTTAPDLATLTRALADARFRSFCHQHHKTVLIFDDELDTHHERFRQDCLSLKDHEDIGFQYARGVFDAGTALEAGFQLGRLNGGSVMTVDLQVVDEESSSDEQE